MWFILANKTPARIRGTASSLAPQRKASLSFSYWWCPCCLLPWTSSSDSRSCSRALRITRRTRRVSLTTVHLVSQAPPVAPHQLFLSLPRPLPGTNWFLGTETVLPGRITTNKEVSKTVLITTLSKIEWSRQEAPARTQMHSLLISLPISRILKNPSY